VLAADAHLSRDPVLKRLIDDGGPLPDGPVSAGRPADLYGALLRSITGQQLSV
jgi:DNA-3-methyladenine glycosylase II